MQDYSSLRDSRLLRAAPIAAFTPKSVNKIPNRAGRKDEEAVVRTGSNLCALPINRQNDQAIRNIYRETQQLYGARNAEYLQKFEPR